MMSDKTEKPFLIIPFFPGFYESWLDGEFDSMVERDSEYYRDDVLGVPDDIKPELWGCWEYGDYQQDASIHWLEALKTWASDNMEAPDDLAPHAVKLLESLEFESTSSPRFYNFETDKLFATHDDSALRAIWDIAKGETTFAELVTERHSSRDGFISFYPRDLDEWPEYEGLDHNHKATLFIWLMHECELDESEESFFYEYMEGLHEVASNSSEFKESLLVERIATAAIEFDSLDSVETAQELEESTVFEWIQSRLLALPDSYSHFQSTACAVVAGILEAVPNVVLDAYEGGLEAFARCPATLDLFPNEESKNA